MTTTNNKVALVTGGANGIGFEFVRSLLKNGVKGVVVADIQAENGTEAVKELNKEFGPNKAVFIKTDVCNKNQLEDAFKKAIEVYKQLDIVINNAGIVDEKNFEKDIALNCTAVVQGTYLAMEEYFPKYKSGHEGIVVNIASLYGLDPVLSAPVYSGTKFFVVGFSQAVGCEENYQRTKTRVLTICPGITDTKIVGEAGARVRNESYKKQLLSELENFKIQPPSHLGKELITVLEKGKPGSVWLIEDSQVAGEIHTPNRFERLKK